MRNTHGSVLFTLRGDSTIKHLSIRIANADALSISIYNALI